MNEDIWPRMEDDYMEIGSSNWVAAEKGWFRNKVTKEMMDPGGNIYNISGELVYDPSEADYEYDEFSEDQEP